MTFKIRANARSTKRTPPPPPTNNFLDPQSDFLTLLNIWHAVHDEWDTCDAKPAAQILQATISFPTSACANGRTCIVNCMTRLDDLGSFKLNESNAAYDAIHRSILAGLIGHVAHYESATVTRWRATGSVSVFPGSALYGARRTSAPAAPERKQAAAEPKTNQPEWIVAGEIVETSQLFARTLAGIDPQWIYRLARRIAAK